MTDLETALQRLVATALQTQAAGRLPTWVDWNLVSLDERLESLGFDSLGRIHFLNALENEFHCSIPETRAAQAQSLRELLHLVMERAGAE